MKLGPAAQSTHERGWPELLCRRDNYLEVARAGYLPTSTVSEVRVSSGTLERLEELRTREVAREPLDPDERQEVRAYQALLRWGRASGTRLVAVI